MEAFIQISRRRLTDNGMPQRLQIEHILSYCKLIGIEDLDSIDDYVFFVTELDEEYINFAHAKIDAERRVRSGKR